MKWHLNKNLSARDMEAMVDTKVYLTMLRQRLIVDFDKKVVPEFNSMGLDRANDLFYIKELGRSVYEFWFLDGRDLRNFEETLIEYKVTGPEDQYDDQIPF